MNTETVANWVQIVTGGAVLAGLVLVAYELNQTRELTEAQLLSEGYFAHQSREIAHFGNKMLESFDQSDYSISTCATWREGFIKHLVGEEAR